jgi:thioredoxin-related protein
MKALLAVALMLVVAVSALAQTPTKDFAGFDPKADAAKEIKTAIAKAAKENKRVLLDVGGEWCPWCHKLNKLFREDKSIADRLKKNYVVVHVNYSQENENKAVLSKYPEIPGYPHIFVLDKTGKLIQSQDTELLEEGDHHSPKKVIEFLDKWKP